MTKKSMRKGFTLVELLVVIIIIGILAAAALLASGSATDSATASTIVSDLRSLKSAVLLYTADHVGSSDVQIATALGAAGGITKLAAYMDDDDTTNGKFKSGGNYTVATGGAGASKVFVGYTAVAGGVEGKLAGMAAKVGLKGEAKDSGAATYTSGATVYMLAR